MQSVVLSQGDMIRNNSGKNLEWTCKPFDKNIKDGNGSALTLVIKLQDPYRTGAAAQHAAGFDESAHGHRVS